MLVRADRNQLVQMLINLMINAADAMKAGGRLTVRYRTGEHGRKVLIDITDSGTGIPQDQLDRIFEPFYTTKATGAGTGLGLSVVARIIEAHERSDAAVIGGVVENGADRSVVDWASFFIVNGASMPPVPNGIPSP